MFYHINLDLEKEIKVFKPIIPNEYVRLDTEDATTPRICVSKSIGGCLSAVPWGGIGFENHFDDDNVIFKVYEFDEKDILTGNLIKPDYLYKKDLVRDAEYTKEHWIINQELKPINSYLVIVNFTDYEETSEDDISYKNLKRCEEEDLDYEDYIEGSFTIINLYNYTKIPLSETIKTDTITFNEKDIPLNLVKIEKYIEEFYNSKLKSIEVKNGTVFIKLFVKDIIPIKFIQNKFIQTLSKEC